MADVTIRQRFIHQAPRKLRLVASLVRGQQTTEALRQLTTMNKIAAKPVAHGVRSAVAAAKGQRLNPDNLIISRIFVDEGPAMKRRILHSRGRAARMEHRMSHLTITLAAKNVTPAKSKNEVA